MIIDDMELEIKISNQILHETLKEYKKDGKKNWPCQNVSRLTKEFMKLTDSDLVRMRMFLRKEYLELTKSRSMNMKKEKYIYFLDKELTEIYNRRLNYSIQQKLINRKEER